MIKTVGWLVSFVMACIMVHIMISSVEISILNLVMFNAMMGLCFNTVEKIIIFMLNVLHQFGASMVWCIMWICISMMFLMVTCASMIVVPVGVMGDWFMDLMHGYRMSVVNYAMSIMVGSVF